MQSLFIDKPNELKQLCQQLQDSPFLSVDTEFVRERTYYPRLALIQIGNEEVAACIDPLAIDDLTPLKTLFQNPAITKVFHAASQDMEIFQFLFGELPTPAFDTQIAAAVLGIGEQVGYANLVKAVLDIDLDKSQTRTDWLQRPLAQKQIRYAEDDVRYLTQIYPKLMEQLTALDRLHWLDEDFQALTDIKRYLPNPDKIWRKVKGVNRLKGVQLAILQAVARWREEVAMDADRPRRRIIGDELLIDMARLKPANRAALSKLRGIAPSIVERHGERLVSLISKAQQLPREQWPSLPSYIRLDAAQEAQVDALNAIVKLCAAQYNINATNLVNRKELERLVSGERDLPVLQGWRRHHGGEQLLAFIEGNSSLQMADGALRLNLR